MWKRNFKSAQAYRQHKAGGSHIGIEITQNASLRLICHTPYEQQCLVQWQPLYPQHIPTVDIFLPECDIMFPKVVGSLRVLGVSGVSGVSESQTVNCTIAQKRLNKIFLLVQKYKLKTKHQ